MTEPQRTADERAATLPLVTETATVSAVEALDGDRTDDIREGVDRRFDEWDVAPPDDLLDFEAVFSALPDDLPAGVRDDLHTLEERHERPYPSLVRLELAPEEDLEFAPGQFATIRFEHVPRPYSLASSPNDDELELCIRRVPGGHLTDRLFSDLREGDLLPELRGPSGDFTLRDPSKRDMVFLATGTGVAPLRSMIRYTFQEGQDEHDGEKRDVWLFHGCSWLDDLAYFDEFQSLDSEYDHFHYVPTLSRESVIANWEGETDYVQRAFVKHLDGDVSGDGLGDLADALDEDPVRDPGVRIDPENTDVYACGVSAMVATLEDVASAAGVPDSGIRGEGFG